jgi:hypothetical protein
MSFSICLASRPELPVAYFRLRKDFKRYSSINRLIFK